MRSLRLLPGTHVHEETEQDLPVLLVRPCLEEWLRRLSGSDRRRRRHRGCGRRATPRRLPDTGARGADIPRGEDARGRGDRSPS